ncbi:MAG TPA: hypothetical protein PK493_06925 [Pseudomonadota bacterium]|nr:hypothetical protein [Pseudomonadota bacterium]
MSKTPQNPTSPPESHYPRDPAARERDPNFWTASHGRAVDPDVLPRVLSRAAALREQAVLVFDLDSTLLDNKPRQARIVREAGQALGEPRLLGCQPEHFTEWSVDKPLRRLGLRDEEIPDLVPKVRRFWKQRFFTSEYCVDDIAIAGAVAFVRDVLAAGSKVAYCTGRHEGMRQGTVACFAREGFPVPDGDRVHLLMKPDLETHDDDFKVRARQPLAALGTVIAAFDNEPIHINSYFVHFTDAQCVHMLTDDSARGIAPHQSIPSIRDFRRG